jgi:hypothetical protein
MMTPWVRRALLTCQRCLEPLTSETPAGTWINTGQCRRCLIARSESGNECAWCLSEFGIEPRVNDSHGICRRHERELVGAR